MRVRWSTLCAGGCDTWLTAGTYAPRMHRGLWCDGCALAHVTRCGDDHAETAAARPLPQPALW